MSLADNASPESVDVIASDDDLRLVAALRAGDEAAFAALVAAHQPSMLRVAALFLPDPALAEDVVQDAWLGVLRGLSRFEGRSALKTWIFRILANTAKTRGQREGRSVPFSALWPPEATADEPAVAPDRFLPPDHAQWPGHWSDAPNDWDNVPEERLLARETLGVVHDAIAGLPPAQRAVITLRDMEHWPSQEICNVLDISQTNQRVLLHRARSKVRQALERYLDEAREAHV